MDGRLSPSISEMSLFFGGGGDGANGQKKFAAFFANKNEWPKENCMTCYDKVDVLLQTDFIIWCNGIYRV